MTRLLVPEMFGLMAIVNVLIVGLALFTDIGLGENVIQSKRAGEDTFLNTVWTVQVLRGFFIWVCSIIVALGVCLAQHLNWMPISTAYAEPLLPWIIPIATFTSIISAFEPTWTSIAGRNLQQSRLVKIGLFCQFSSIIITIVFAYFSRTIWALVIGTMLGNLIRSIIVNFFIQEKRNHFHLDKGALNEVFHFGKWIFLSSCITFLGTSGDRLLLGGFVSAKELGIYSMAAFMVSAIVDVLSKLVSSVVYPVISETVREKPDDLKRIYYRFRVPFDAFTLFLCGFLLLTGQTIINVMYDTRYESAGWMLSILAFSLVAMRFRVADKCYVALGKPKIQMILNFVRATSVFLTLPIGFSLYGVRGAMWSIALCGFVSFPWEIYYKKQHGLLDVKKELITIPLFFVGLVCGYLFNQIIPVLSKWAIA